MRVVTAVVFFLAELLALLLGIRAAILGHWFLFTLCVFTVIVLMLVQQEEVTNGEPHE